MRRDKSYLEDIRLAAQDIAAFIDGMTLHDFEENALTRAGVERKLITIGEAANHISGGLKTTHPSPLWEQVVQLRNYYVHGYDRLSAEIVWGSAKRLAPRMGRMATKLIPIVEEETP